jgi:hypothetical protein
MRRKMEMMNSQFVKFVEFMRDRLGEEMNVTLDETSTDLVPLSDKGASIMRLIDALRQEASPDEDRDEPID